VSEIIEELPTAEDALWFIQCCRYLHTTGEYEFNKKRFRVLPIGLAPEALRNANRFANLMIEKSSGCFLREILIRIDRASLDIEDELANLLKKSLQASTKCNTIVIRYGLGSHPHEALMVIWAIDQVLSVRPFKLLLQNMPVSDSRKLLDDAKRFHDRIYSLELRMSWINHHLRDTRHLDELLALTTNLKALSIIVTDRQHMDTDRILEHITEVHSEGLESLSLTNFVTSKAKLEGLFYPFRASLKEIKLQEVRFEDASFTDFIDYTRDSLSLESISLGNIRERTRGLGFRRIENPMGFV
jgi:hypothetical protein